MNRFKMIICCLSIFFGILPIVGQGESATISNGIRAAWRTEFSKPFPKNIKRFSSGSSKKGVRSHHVFADMAEKTYFGYDLKVEAHTEKNKFKVTIQRLSVRPKNKYIDTSNLQFRDLPNYPGTMIVRDGETIVLDILENPKTKEKISHLIRVTRNTSGPVFADLHRAKDFTLDDVNLKFHGYDVFIDGKKAHSTGGGASGGNIGIYLPGRGRFIMSPFKREGYNFQKIGKIVNNKISFTFHGIKYEVVTKSPILGEGGKWNAWVLFEPNFVPSKPRSPDRISTQGGSIDGFFRKKK